MSVVKLPLEGTRFESPPTYLDGLAKKEWRRILPGLIRLKRYDAGMSPTLAAYCDWYSEYKARAATEPPPRGTKSRLRELKHLAREFGFLLDQYNRIDLTRPLPLPPLKLGKRSRG